MSYRMKRISWSNNLPIEGSRASNGQVTQIVNALFYCVRLDWESNPIRLILEWIGMSLAISASLILTVSISEPPLLQMLSIWIVSGFILLGCALSRGSTAMATFNVILLSINITCLLRLCL